MNTTAMLVGAGLLCLGFLPGLVVGALLAARPPRSQEVRSQEVKPICACGHPISAHLDDPSETDEYYGCQEDVRRRNPEKFGGWEWVPCACTRYVGPVPLTSDIWVPPMTTGAES